MNNCSIILPGPGEEDLKMAEAVFGRSWGSGTVAGGTRAILGRLYGVFQGQCSIQQKIENRFPKISGRRLNLISDNTFLSFEKITTAKKNP